MNHHTPEPWILSDDCEPDRVGGNGQHPPAYVPRNGPDFVLGIDAAGRRYMPSIPDMRRLVACVNACAGMTDPVAEVTRLRAIEVAARAIIQIVPMDVEPWDQEKEGSIDYCRHCHAPEYRPHRDDCAWKREQAIRDALVSALNPSTDRSQK